MPRGVPNKPKVAEAEMPPESIETTLTDSAPEVVVEASQGQQDMDALKEMFFGHFPKYRPSFADLQLLNAGLYGITLRGSMSHGQRLCLKQLKERLLRKGVI